MNKIIIIVILFCSFLFAQEKDINKQLLSALQDCEFEEVKRLVSLGADVNYKGNNGATPLTYALIGPNLNYEMTIYLINNGAKINNYTNGERTPLMIAVHSLPNIKTVNLLLEKTENVNITNEFGENALLIACDGYYPHYQSGYTSIVKELINRGSKLDLVSTEFNRNGYTALLLAAKNGYDKILIDLINAGADINVKNKEGKNALIIAVENSVYTENKNEYDYIETIKILISKIQNINEKDNFGNTALNIIENNINTTSDEDNKNFFSTIKTILINSGAK